MRQMLRFASFLIAVVLATSADAQDPSPLKTENDELNYALGARIGRDLRDRSVLEVKPELLLKGISDALSGREMLMTDHEIYATINSYRQKLVLAEQQRAEENRRKEAEFLASNKKQEGVVTLKSGLQYKILKQGDGPKPRSGDMVVVHYRGTLLDGTEFDNSYARKQPAIFPLKRVIKGWREALPLMTAGSKWRLFVPSRLAYGARGNGHTIGPNVTLIFEVELIDVKGKDAADSSALVAHSEVSNTTGDDGANDIRPENLPRLVVSFKLDPSLMGGSYAQPGWVTPQVYQGVSGQTTVEAKVDGIDASGNPVRGIKAEWIPEDPEMVTVSAGQDNLVKILIHRPGQSNVMVVSGETTQTLSIKATTTSNDILQVTISQL
jgi:FKBP-type peptidyl-prolyl cis-trans isomerase FklB